MEMLNTTLGRSVTPDGPGFQVLPFEAAPVKTALICDDDPLQRISARACLRNSGFRVLEAESAEESLRLIESGEDINLLILEIMLPGMSGLDLLEKLQMKKFSFQCITISGVFRAEEIETKSTASGSIMHLDKPVKWTSFGRLAREIVNAATLNA